MLSERKNNDPEKIYTLRNPNCYRKLQRKHDLTSLETIP